jgi:hypothetical protein
MPSAFATAPPLGGVAPLSTAGVLPDLVLEVAPDLADLVGALARAVARLAGAEARFRELALAGTAADRDRLQLVAELEATANELRTVRAEIDRWSPVEAAPGADAAAWLAGWRWERRTRAATVRMAERLQTSRKAAREVARGRGEVKVLVRSGDTWQALAQVHMGDWQAWPRLVKHNGGDPTGPVPGSVVTIPVR